MGPVRDPAFDTGPGAQACKEAPKGSPSGREHRGVVLDGGLVPGRAQVGAIAAELSGGAEERDERAVIDRPLDDVAVAADVRAIPVGRLPGREQRSRVVLLARLAGGAVRDELEDGLR